MPSFLERALEALKDAFRSGALSGPGAHAGVSLSLAILLGLNPAVTVLSGILPDMVDKPLAALSIGGGRYVGHTLLFAAVTVALFTLWRRRFGLAALVGVTSHLVLDLDALMPWFYPFRNYAFYHQTMSIREWLRGYLTLGQSGWDVVAGVAALAAAFLVRRAIVRRRRPSRPPQASGG